MVIIINELLLCLVLIVDFYLLVMKSYFCSLCCFSFIGTYLGTR